MLLLEAVAVYLAIINLTAFMAFAADKRMAVDGRQRVPERQLLQLAAIGGSLGAVAAQQMLRHKTRKEPFRTHLRLVLLAQICAVACLAFWRLAAR